jgi:hypothetical protein
VCEGLGQVPAHLPLRHVELLREEAGRPAGRAIAFKPPRGLERSALLFERERHPETAEDERALGLAESALIGAIPVAVQVVGELELDR